MTRCPICQASERRPLYQVRGHAIVSCSRCTGWYLRDPAAAQGLYAGDYLQRGRTGVATHGYFDYEADAALHLRNFARNVEILGEFGASGRLCDIGCASGHFLQAAQRSGRFSAVAGVDVSAAAIEAVKARLGCPAWSGAIETMPAPERFDVVTMWETIEHITRPVEALAALRGWLRPKGILAVGTGDNRAPLARLLGRRWWYLVPPDHCVYFNRLALSIALKRAGYRVLGWRRIWLHWVSAANATMKIMRSLDIPPGRAIATAARLGGVPLPIAHGTTLVAIACADDSGR